MELSLLFVFVGIVVIQSATPGPSVILLISNGARYGARTAFIALTGDLLGITLLALLSAIGAGSFLLANAYLFSVIKILGAGYLLYIGIKSLLTATKPLLKITPLDAKNTNVNLVQLWIQSLLVALSNPKAILFFAALFPQFINTNDSLLPQFLLLTAIFVLTKAILLGFYALFAERLNKIKINQTIQRLLHSIKSMTFIGFGVLLLKSATSESK